MAELSAESPRTPNLHDSSPLGSLIGRTSSRRVKGQRPANLEPLTTPSRPAPSGSAIPSAPPSPILHTQFRDSTATATSFFVDGASMRTLSWDARSQITVPPSPSTYHGPVRAYESLPSGDDVESITNRYRDTWRSSGVVDPSSVYDPPDVPDLPTVVVSAAPEPPPALRPWEREYDVPGPSKGGRIPSRVTNNNTVNFSRPVPPVDIYSSQSEERKREVLMRNAHNHPPSRSPTPSRAPGSGSRPYSPLHSPASSPGLSPTASGHGWPASGPVSPASLSEQSASPYEGSTQPQRGFTSPAPVAQAHRQPSAPGLLPSPGPRIDSAQSVYSNYSFYELPLTTTSTTQLSSSGLSQPPLQPPASAPAHMQAHPLTPTTPGPGPPRAKSSAGKAKAANTGVLANPQTAQDFLQVGIQHHLENRLAESAAAFEKSATLGGGCGVGMLMWGLAQRHGWGCEKNEQAGFRWLRRAAELAVTDLEKGKQGDMSAVKSELVLAIYEVGQSFFRGWGVQKDKEMAVQYYRVAARLDDPDAQQELAFCLLNGKGCKKDKKEAAKWYRAAVQQGASDVGLAWIYKEKYQ